MKTRMSVKPFALCLPAATPASCGGGSDLDGRYDEGSMMSFELKARPPPDFMGESPIAEMPIRRFGDRLTIEAENGTLIYSMDLESRDSLVLAALIIGCLALAIWGVVALFVYGSIMVLIGLAV